MEMKTQNTTGNFGKTRYRRAVVAMNDAGTIDHNDLSVLSLAARAFHAAHRQRSATKKKRSETQSSVIGNTTIGESVCGSTLHVS
jgi:hypothetical protein